MELKAVGPGINVMLSCTSSIEANLDQEVEYYGRT